MGEIIYLGLATKLVGGRDKTRLNKILKYVRGLWRFIKLFYFCIHKIYQNRVFKNADCLKINPENGIFKLFYYVPSFNL